jgi:hypothetical protein
MVTIDRVFLFTLFTEFRANVTYGQDVIKSWINLVLIGLILSFMEQFLFLLSQLGISESITVMNTQSLGPIILCAILRDSL